ncbi:prepilin-type N-terminal cleavage/methylation domain-containing protein (plasmid) [Thermus oshimai JL-2]|uniref:Prepilin-type N-terminal cleavage/methylation domain-containing protein n=1 Tax=Thermus oshimai JL-2 TaxID=751945 RepID=K7QWU7_THEOS|nr:prepilin-type N-terminal cleavage/methylation domain-containing protein [Thermus oshimai]AFV77326.1 prepilin-type N-terminal cleavage/methylation domain-containing protein [Thermus oshimai JL-2]
MPQKRSTLASAKGLTLIELLVALGIGALILALSLGLVLSNRQLYTLDQTRTALNQNLRAALDLLGADIRQAGERTPMDFPAVQVSSGNTLVLRRNLLEAVLTLCDRNGIRAGSSQDVLFVARRDHSPPPQCLPQDGDGNGWDDRLEAFARYRQENGGEVTFYLYDPTTGRGEFFPYDAEDQSRFHIHRARGRWTNDYPGNGTSRIYALEERRYVLQDGLLHLILNGNAAAPLRLVDRVTGFRVAVRTQDGRTHTDFGSRGQRWTDVAAILVEVTVQEGGRSRTLSGEYFPRNVLSQ